MIRPTLTSVLALLALACPQLSAAREKPQSTLTPLAEASVPAAAPPRLEQSAVRFEANAGQTDGSVRFVAQGAGSTLFLTSDEAVMRLGTPERGAVLRMRFEGSSPDVVVEGEAELPGRTNYFIGNDPSRWHTDVPAYARVRYAGLYPGVDAVFYDGGGALEYDFVVAPGADASAIVLAFDGADRLEIDERGELVLVTGVGEVRQRAPRLYQMDGEQRVPVSGGYVLLDRDRVGFRAGAWDASRPLVIDPLLVFSTYLGGSAEDLSRSVTVDESGAVYVTGQTRSINFPRLNAVDTTFGLPTEAFVTKLSADGSTLVYSTYLGGAVGDGGASIVVTAAGEACVVGGTNSADFPTVNAFDSTLGGVGDAFLTKLSANGNSLIFSTFLGGSGNDGANGLAIDSLGALYLTGIASGSFPLLNPFDSNSNFSIEAFVTKMAPDALSLVYSTFIGGDGFDTGLAITVDAAGAAYITGIAGIDSLNFPVVNAYDATNNGMGDAFVTKLNPAGNTAAYSTFLGGTGLDQGRGIAVDAAGRIYVVGITGSTNFPTTGGVFDTTPAGDEAYVTVMSPDGASLHFSTLLGGSGYDIANGVAVDATGAVYVVGLTQSADFPTRDAVDSTLGGISDAFVTKLNSTGTGLVYSTFLDGSGFAGGQAVAVDATGAVYVTGDTDSTDFPTVNAYDTTPNGGADAFVAKLGAADPKGTDTPGIYVPSTGAWFLRNSTTAGNADLTFFYGAANAGYIAITGDWNGDGVDTPGLYDPVTGALFLRNSNTPGPADLTFQFGAGGASFLPIAGDWNGDGVDTIGIYNSANGTFFLRNSNSSGPGNLAFQFGAGGAMIRPVTGDFDGDGDDTVGIYDTANGAFFLKNTNASGVADLTFFFGAGGASIVPVPGDWDGDGDDTVGIYDTANGSWFLRNQNSAGAADLTFFYGPAGATPLKGDWNAL